jgi:hypothetical protein
VTTTARGLEISDADDAAVAAVDDFTFRLARIRPGVEAVLAAADHHPGTATLQLYAAMLWLYAQTDEATATAAGYLDRAAALESSMDERERATFAALTDWRDKRFSDAAARFEAVTVEWPRDLVALKALEFMYYVLGQQHSGPRFLAHVEKIADPNRDDPDVLAVWAFAAELTGQVDRAADLVEQCRDIEADVPWAHHALAHVLITTGDGVDARDRLTAFLPMWETSGRVIYCHNAWHLALVHLDELDADGAEAIFRDHIWGVTPDMPGEQIDAISLLWRLDMAGRRVDDARWGEVADRVEARAGECYFPFLSAHHAYALARADRREPLDALMAGVAQRTEADDDEARQVWQPVGRAVVEASAASGHGDHRRFAELLDPIIAEMPAVGGSDAQDDLFRQAYLTGLIEAGRTADAERYWKTMTAWKTPSLLDQQWRERW